MRGATNAVFTLNPGLASRGVATHSSGNHAAALACAAARRGIPAYVVMPKNAPAVKRRAVEGYGAEVTSCKPTLQAREEGLAKVVQDTGAYFVHPYNNEQVICGQGTAALEFLHEVPDLDWIMTPVGGGGLLSGTAICAKHLSPGIRVVAGEPANADDAYRSWKSGQLQPSINPKTIADGLLTSLGSLTFPIIQKWVDDIITVPEDLIVSAMRLIWERMKIVIEPSAAVPLGAIMNNAKDAGHNKIGIILSGGNADLDHLPWY